jgi:hypothetical protein
MNLPEGLTGFSPTKSSRKKSQQSVCVRVCLWLIKLQNKSFDFSLGMFEVDQKSYLKTGGLQIVEKLGLVNFFKRSVY